MRFAAFGCLKTFKQQIKNKLSQTGQNDTAGRVWIRAHRPQRGVVRTPPLYCGTATDHPDTALTQDAVRKLQKKKNRKFAEHGNKTVTVTWPNLLSQPSGHVTFWDQTNASVGLCQGAPLWEHTAWRGRYNSAFCSHHLPEDPPTLRHHHTLTSNLTFVAEAPPMTSQLRIQSESRATCKNTNWWLDCSRGRRGSHGRHVRLDQSTLQSGFVTAPPLCEQTAVGGASVGLLLHHFQAERHLTVEVFSVFGWTGPLKKSDLRGVRNIGSLIIDNRIISSM